MKQALFLVTSIDGLKKPTFNGKIEALQGDDCEVAILLAMTNFDEVYQARKVIRNVRGNIDVDKLRVISLFEVYRSEPGVPLKDGEIIQTDFSNLDVHEIDVPQGTVKRFVTQSGDLKAESLFVNEALVHTVFFDEAAQVVQISDYINDQLFGVVKYRDGDVFESLLMNENGELLFRFTASQVSKKVRYLLGNTAVVEAPQELLGTVENEKKPIKEFESSVKTDAVKVISYSDFKRYDDINSFYKRLIANMQLENAEIYLDAVDMVDVAKYLPKQRIFNY
ncbi:hypothetical protein PL11_006950 [Lentilactobacillus curieae]|uniref:Uncharacterized protein n=1 Tax=Lentilactobacillus curieae TaxID=1138822 RepID=A0A1S6QJB4_9LACO|nr:hypothetical protein [Lentilactobacillus curieae]AQW21679.1 hypothetical protein PL11_006950 [Lentilactobacillus curieae]